MDFMTVMIFSHGNSSVRGGGRYHFVQIIRCTVTPDMVVMDEVALLLNIKYSYLVYPTITMVLGNKAIVGAVSVSPF